jgi:glutathione S-transferase
MKLYWSSRSPYARKVMAFAHEAGLAGRIETVRALVSMTAPNKELMRVNPLAKIPTLVTDEGMVLYDSSVICEYLDTLHGGEKLFPADPGRRWPALRWQALGNNMLDNLVPWRNERLRPPAQQSPETLAAFDLKIRNAVASLDTEADALARTAVGIGHVAIGVALGYIDFRFSDLAWRQGGQRIASWHDAFARRPSMQATLPVDA